MATEKWRAKEYDAALADVFAGLALNPADVRIKATLIHRKASIYDNSGSKELGIKFYKKAIELDPEDSVAHNNLGGLYKKQDKLEDAEAEYKIAIELDPKDSKPHNNLGNLYKKQDKLEEAKKEYEEAIRLDPNNSIVKNNLEILENIMKEE